MTPVDQIVAETSNRLAGAWINGLGMAAVSPLVRDKAVGVVVLNLFSIIATADPKERAKQAARQCAKWIKRDVIPALSRARVDNGNKLA